MRVNGTPWRTIWPVDGVRAVDIIDQTALPHAFSVRRLHSVEDAAQAIRSMQVRGAPLIGVTAAHGLALALASRADDDTLLAAARLLAATRPTAVNLHWALARMQSRLLPLPPATRIDAAWAEAATIADEDVDQCRRIGIHGLQLLLAGRRGEGRLEIMTHCNAGWLATVDHGTALAPVYAAFDAGIDIHVWVSETRPRNQGLLTAWELRQHGVPHTVVADNAAGLLLARGGIDAVLVGADRIAANGDVATKIGTCLKALAARAAGVPFIVAAPRSTIDFACANGAAIPIEERAGDELRLLHGCDSAGVAGELRQLPATAAVANPAFDITPASLVDHIVSERGCCTADRLQSLHPEAADG